LQYYIIIFICTKDPKSTFCEIFVFFYNYISQYNNN